MIIKITISIKKNRLIIAYYYISAMNALRRFL